jgi:hypothetical protein
MDYSRGDSFMRKKCGKWYGQRIAGLLFLILWSIPSAAQADMHLRNLKDYVDFFSGTGVITVGIMPETYSRLLEDSAMIEDLRYAYFLADTNYDAYVDPRYQWFLIKGYTPFTIGIEDGRGWTTFFTDHMLGAIRIYDRTLQRFVRFRTFASSRGVSDIRMICDIEDGGPYDLDGQKGNGIVEVAVAIGAGITEDYDFTQSLFGGGCSALGGKTNRGVPFSFLLLFAGVPFLVATRAFRRKKKTELSE